MDKPINKDVRAHILAQYFKLLAEFEYESLAVLLDKFHFGLLMTAEIVHLVNVDLFIFAIIIPILRISLFVRAKTVYVTVKFFGKTVQQFFWTVDRLSFVYSLN